MSSRVAFITGAAQGIGEAIAIRLAADRDELSIALLDVPAKVAQLEGVVKRIKETGRKGIYIIGDVSKEQDVKHAVEKCVEAFGGLDIVLSPLVISHRTARLQRDPIDGSECRYSRL